VRGVLVNAQRPESAPAFLVSAEFAALIGVRPAR
jgi:hypothetical protein